MCYYDMLPVGMSSPVYALTCFALACKYLERDDDIPLIEDLIKGTTHAVRYSQVIRGEFEINDALSWDLRQPTVYDFVRNYLG